MPVITRTSATPAPLERPAASRRLVSFLTSRTGVRHKIDGKWLLAAAFVALSGSGSLLATPTAEVQPEWQATSDIEETAAAYIRSRMPATGGDTSVAANRLDPRLRLARCDRALEAFVRPGTRVQSRTTVGVRD